MGVGGTFVKFLYAVLRAQFLIKKNSFAKIEKALEKDNKYFFLNLVQNKFFYQK